MVQVIFGWGYDGARWNPDNSLGQFTTGPIGLTSLLATRLGLTTPDVPHVQRIAAYRRVLQAHLEALENDTQRPWFAQSFAKDPWATARQVLAWRDELVGAGWRPDEHHDASMPPRLATLARVERALDQEPTWPAGNADIFRDVAEELQWLVTAQLPFQEIGRAHV